MFKINDEQNHELSNYTPMSVSGINLLIHKAGREWEICIPTDSFLGVYPHVIGSISNLKGGGIFFNTTRLAWRIDEEYRNSGIMKAVLEKYMNEVEPEKNGFEVMVNQRNIPSIKLALGAGFKLSESDDEWNYYLK